MLEKEGVEANSPRMVFRTCSERGIVPQDLAQELVVLINVRNQTTYTYDQEVAEKVVADILKHALVFAQVLELGL